MFKLLNYVKRIFVTFKFQLDVGISFVTLVNLLLLVYTVFKNQTYIKLHPLLICLMVVPVIVLCAWFFGFFLDKIIHYQDAYQKVATDRIPQITEVLERLKNIEKKIEKK